DFPPPSVEYPMHAVLGDIDLAIATCNGTLGQRPGPVHMNFCFRENLAPDGGPVRGVAGRSAEWDQAYVNTAEMHRWANTVLPRSTYVSPVSSLSSCSVLQELVDLAQRRARIVVLVGTLRTSDEVLLAEDIALRLGAAVFGDITSGLRQRPCAVHYADQLLNSPFLSPENLQIEAVVHLGGPLCSARLNAFSKASAGARLHVRVAPGPVRMDQDHIVTHHLPCCLEALAQGLAEAGLEAATGPPAFWKRLSDAAGSVLERMLSPGEGACDGRLTEPFIAQTVSRLMCPGERLQISSSMPIRDLDFFAKPFNDSCM
ncbi:unnamed protein product, partial [Polarella glacialis]